MSKKIISLLLIFSFFSQFSIFAADSKTPEPYKDEEFPGFLHDLRRAEIITLGAMPFITFNATLGYSFGKFAYHGFDSSYFVNPFAQSSDSSFSTEEQVGIILGSLGVSLCIGITDLIVNSVKRNNAKKKKLDQNAPIKINPIENDENAVKIDLPPEINEFEEQNFENSEQILENSEIESENLQSETKTDSKIKKGRPLKVK